MDKRWRFYVTNDLGEKIKLEGVYRLREGWEIES